MFVLGTLMLHEGWNCDFAGWLSKAAAARHADAMFTLAIRYTHRTRGVDVDEAKALECTQGPQTQDARDRCSVLA